MERQKFFKLHHSAMSRGYRRMRDGELVVEYNGRFGLGYIVHYPTQNYHGNKACGNRYHMIEYYIEA